MASGNSSMQTGNGQQQPRSQKNKGQSPDHGSHSVGSLIAIQSSGEQADRPALPDPFHRPLYHLQTMLPIPHLFCKEI